MQPHQFIIPKTMKIEIPLCFVEYETVFNQECKAIEYEMTNKITWNDIESEIRKQIENITYQGKVFAEIGKIRIVSSKCSFYNISRNDKLRNVPLLTIFQGNMEKIPDCLYWNSFEAKKKGQSYKCSLGIKSQFKFNIFPKMYSYYHSHDSQQSNNVLIDNKDRIIDNCNNGKIEEKKNELESESIESKDYKYDELNMKQCQCLCDNDIRRINLWEKHGLKKLTDIELCRRLYAMLKQYWQEAKTYDFESDCIREMKEIDKRVDAALKHKTHKKMGYPLSACHILSIILYCNTNMYTNLTNCQINGNYKDLEKYIVFDYCLFWAITYLHEFSVLKIPKDVNMIQKFEFQLFSGSHGVIFNTEKLEKNKSWIDFMTFTSFSLNYNVALDCTSSRHASTKIKTILCLNSFNGVVWADVSWISQFKNEMEILVRRHCGTQYLGDTYKDDIHIIHLGCPIANQ